MNFRDIDIHELLPQQEPFIMIGSLAHFDMKDTVSVTLINDNILVDNGQFTASGIIENIAQTCAARIGYINKYIHKKGIQLGFIGAIRKLKLFRLPMVGETIVTRISVQEEIFGMILVSAKVSIDNEIVAESEMKIALSDMGSKASDQK